MNFKYFRLYAVLFGFSLFMLSGCAVTGQYVDEDETQVEDFAVEAPESEGSIVILEDEEQPAKETAAEKAKEKSVKNEPEAVETVEPAESYEEAGAVEAEKETRQIPADAVVHKVWIYQETGDCLWMLAKKYYGDPWKWKKIYLENQDIIENPNIIFPKQELIIPSENE